jgi:hypothetical protein
VQIFLLPLRHTHTFFWSNIALWLIFLPPSSSSSLAHTAELAAKISSILIFLFFLFLIFSLLALTQRLKFYISLFILRHSNIMTNLYNCIHFARKCIANQPEIYNFYFDLKLIFFLATIYKFAAFNLHRDNVDTACFRYL